MPINITDPVNPVITVILPAVSDDVWGIEVRKSDNTTVLYHADLSASGYLPSVVDIGNTTRNLSYYVYTYNILGEFSIAYNLTYTIPSPAVSGLAVDDATKLIKWSGSNASGYHVEVATDAGFTSLVIDKTTTDPFFPLADSDFFPTRYIRVTPYDDLGNGSSSNISHTYNDTAVASFGATEVFAVGAPATPTVDPVVPTSLVGVADAEYIKESWLNYRTNFERY